MPKADLASLARLGAASLLSAPMISGCASVPMQAASNYASQGAHAASAGAQVVYTTGGNVYAGMGAAAKRPFQDFNIMQDPIPEVLRRAESKPYEVDGLESCAAILDRVAELDLALGPDVDSPKDKRTGRVSQGATLAAEAALDAAGAAAEGILPMRSIVKRVTGATRYEAHVKHALLAGTVRRAFLKAVGMEHNCGWPAAPLGFQPVQLATAADPTQSASTQSASTQSASTQPAASVKTARNLAPVAQAYSGVQSTSVQTSTVRPSVQTMAFHGSSASAPSGGAPWGPAPTQH